MTVATTNPIIEDSLVKDRSGFLAVLRKFINAGFLDTSGTLLVVGGSDGDASVLRNAGWSSMTLSNYSSHNGTSQDHDYLRLDVEDLSLPDESFDTVAAYEVLHHCRSPHRALCEMLRVARRYVFLQDPADSVVYALLRGIGLISPFEIGAVVGNDFVAGGVRNTAIPNFIYRWDHDAVYKTAMSFVPERVIHVHSYPYWEINHTEAELRVRMDARIGYIIKAVGGPKNLQRILRVLQATLNTIPLSRRLGNQFFCCIEKTEQLRAWLLREGDEIVFNRNYPKQSRGY